MEKDIKGGGKEINRKLHRNHRNPRSSTSATRTWRRGLKNCGGKRNLCSENVLKITRNECVWRRPVGRLLKILQKGAVEESPRRGRRPLGLETNQIPYQGSDRVPDLVSFNGGEGRHRSQPTEKTETDYKQESPDLETDGLQQVPT